MCTCGVKYMSGSESMWILSNSDASSWTLGPRMVVTRKAWHKDRACSGLYSLQVNERLYEMLTYSIIISTGDGA